MIKSKLKKKKQQRVVRSLMTRELLLLFGEFFTDWIDMMEFLSVRRYRSALVQGGLPYARELRAEEQKRLMRQWMYELRRRKWIEEKKRGDRILVTLSDRGKKIFMRERVKNAPACEDGECIIVMFDVPEKNRIVRDQLRHFLKSCDFTQLQKSVWCVRDDIFKELQSFIRETGSEEWIRVFRAREV